MREHLLRVLEMAKPYRTRLVLGLLCGFLSGALAPTLGISLKLAVDAVFPDKAALSVASASESAGQAPDTNPGKAQATSNARNSSRLMPPSLQSSLDKLTAWFRPSGPPSKTRLLLVISFIPAAMFLRSLLAYLNTYLLSWVAIRAANDMRVRLFRHLIHLPLRFFNRASTGDLMTRIEGPMCRA